VASLRVLSEVYNATVSFFDAVLPFSLGLLAWLLFLRRGDHPRLGLHDHPSRPRSSRWKRYLTKADEYRMCSGSGDEIGFPILCR